MSPPKDIELPKFRSEKFSEVGFEPRTVRSPVQRSNPLGHRAPFRRDEPVKELMPTIVRQFRKWSNWVHKKLPHLIYFALATNYFNVFMSTFLLGLTSFEKIGGQWIFGGASDFSNLLAPWASGSRSLMLRAERDYGGMCIVENTIRDIILMCTLGDMNPVWQLVHDLLHYLSTVNPCCNCHPCNNLRIAIFSKTL